MVVVVVVSVSLSLEIINQSANQRISESMNQSIARPSVSHHHTTEERRETPPPKRINH